MAQIRLTPTQMRTRAIDVRNQGLIFQDVIGSMQKIINELRGFP